MAEVEVVLIMYCDVKWRRKKWAEYKNIIAWNIAEYIANEETIYWKNKQTVSRIFITAGLMWLTVCTVINTYNKSPKYG